MTADEQEAIRRAAPMPLTADLRAVGFTDPVEIGGDRFGVVYRCSQPALDRRVAVKILSASPDADDRARFLREQNILLGSADRLDIVGVLHFGITPGNRPYLVRSLHSLDSLEDRLRRHGPLPTPDTLAIGEKIARALDAAHALGVVHGDVEPGNVLFTDRGVPTLTAFGIARMVEKSPTVPAGSPGFTAPEVLAGGPLTAAADMYGLGATVLCALTGYSVFVDGHRGDGKDGSPPPTARSGPNPAGQVVPEEVSALVSGVMSRDPGDRPTARELAEAIGRLRRHSRYSTTAPPPSPDLAPRRPDEKPDLGAMRTPKAVLGQGSDGNLPVELTTFVNRRTELSAIKNLLSTGRLVTVTGIGGVGKTRLALRAADQARAAFADGVWLVELAGVTDSSLLVDVLAATIGVRDDTNHPLRDVVLDLLSTREALLVLDNCEHLVGAVAALAETLLRVCPDLRILATSREQLDAAGERVVRVVPLTVPDPDVEPALVEMPRFDGVALFVDRAAAVVRGFEIDEHNKADVARICARLDGLPLALELAAARMRTMSAAQIVQRLTDRYTLLTRGSRTAPTRQQTLQWCIDWSYSLCSPEEQQLWARLSVFAGSFTLESAERVCFDDLASESDTDPIDQLSSLMDKSIVIREESDYGVRFRMLETVGDYGLAKLRASGEEPVMRRRHRARYQQLATEASAGWISPRQPEWNAKLELNLGNLRVALESLLSEQLPESAEAAMRMISELAEFWLFRGLHSEARAWVERALLHPGARSVSARVTVLCVGSHIATVQGDFDSAAEYLERARGFPERDLPVTPRARIAYCEGMLALSRGDPASAGASLRHAADLLGAGDTSSLRVCVLTWLGLSYELCNDTDRAERSYQEVLAITGACGESYYRSSVLRGLGGVAWQRGDHERARPLFEKALRLNRLMYSPYLTALNLDALAYAVVAEGEFERAAVLIGAAQGMWPSGNDLLLNMSWFHAECDRVARDALGERRFDAARKHGRALSVDAALAYALRDQPTSGPSAPGSDTGLTKRERQVAELVAQGLSNRQIAAELVVAQRTAQGHVENILTKLGFTSRTQIAAWIVGTGK